MAWCGFLGICMDASFANGCVPCTQQCLLLCSSYFFRRCFMSLRPLHASLMEKCVCVCQPAYTLYQILQGSCVQLMCEISYCTYRQSTHIHIGLATTLHHNYIDSQYYLGDMCYKKTSASTHKGRCIYTQGKVHLHS